MRGFLNSSEPSRNRRRACSPLFRRIVVKLSSIVVGFTPLAFPLAGVFATLAFAKMVIPVRLTAVIAIGFVHASLIFLSSILLHSRVYLWLLGLTLEGDGLAAPRAAVNLICRRAPQPHHLQPHRA